MIQLKRIYEPPAKEDGARILVDRLWPRGLSKEKARIDLWLKEIAPSPQLRTWFSHEPKKFTQFKRRYIEELKSKTDALRPVGQLEKRRKTVTLLFGAQDKKHNNAVVLSEFYRSTAS